MPAYLEKAYQGSWIFSWVHFKWIYLHIVLSSLLSEGSAKITKSKQFYEQFYVSLKLRVRRLSLTQLLDYWSVWLKRKFPGQVLTIQLTYPHQPDKCWLKVWKMLLGTSSQRRSQFKWHKLSLGSKNWTNSLKIYSRNTKSWRMWRVYHKMQTAHKIQCMGMHGLPYTLAYW